jgi:hypothetical protein
MNCSTLWQRGPRFRCEEFAKAPSGSPGYPLDIEPARSRARRTRSGRSRLLGTHPELSAQRYNPRGEVSVWITESDHCQGRRYR